jgi:hypothetical protein
VTPSKITAATAATAAVPDVAHGVEEAEVDEPLADETVERRQAGNRDRTEGEEPGRPRHRSPESAELTHLAGAGGVQDGAGAEEEQGLEEAVIPDVQERAGEGELPPGGVGVFGGDEGAAETDENDADVFDAVVGEEAFEVVLAEGEGDAEDGADARARRRSSRRRWARATSR